MFCTEIGGLELTLFSCISRQAFYQLYLWQHSLISKAINSLPILLHGNVPFRMTHALLHRIIRRGVTVFTLCSLGSQIGLHHVQVSREIADWATLLDRFLDNWWICAGSNSAAGMQSGALSGLTMPFRGSEKADASSRTLNPASFANSPVNGLLYVRGKIGEPMTFVIRLCYPDTWWLNMTEGLEPSC